MNGFIDATARSACLLGGLLGLVGCAHYRDVADPCYPERYMAVSRKLTNQTMAPQVQNGIVLDQTVWDSHFEPGTNRLTPSGFDHLDMIVRRRPAPYSTVYLQTVKGVPFDPAAPPQKLIDARAALNRDRKKAVENYLVAAAAGRDLKFNVEIHDPATAGLSAVYMNSTVRFLQLAPIYGQLRPTGATVSQGQTVGTTTSFP